MKQRTKHNSAAADRVVAATAGADNWKTWAGRSHGGDDFEVLDLFRGFRRSLHAKFVVGTVPKQCPVCFCQEADEWHWTSSCHHVVCMDCFRAYAKNQVNDPEHSGPLKCPCCPQALRKSDAIVALAGDEDVIKAWDNKIRNQLLRALPSYRSCPRCSGNSTNHDTEEETNNTYTRQGGGFVTPACLTPQYEERRSDALGIIKWGGIGTLLATFFIYISMAHYVSNYPSRSIAVDVFFLLTPLYVIFGKGVNVTQRWVMQRARAALFRPILVECPCCNLEFILPASAETIHDEETKKWMDDNSRRCPSCSAPITKISGCNHMKCSHCQAQFCWACMRLRTSCGAYNCRNGGRNAIPNENAQNNGRLGNNANEGSILARLDHILEREPVQLQLKDGILIFTSLFLRDAQVIQTLVDVFVRVLSILLTTEFFTFCVLVFTMYSMIKRNTHLEMNHHHRRRRRQVGPEIDHPMRPRNRRLEEAMVAEAIRRSLQDQ